MPNIIKKSCTLQQRPRDETHYANMNTYNKFLIRFESPVTHGAHNHKLKYINLM